MEPQLTRRAVYGRRKQATGRLSAIARQTVRFGSVLFIAEKLAGISHTKPKQIIVASSTLPAAQHDAPACSVFLGVHRSSLG